MKLYFAPLEGVAKHMYRRAFHECFSGIDKFYTPFLSPSEHCTIHPREKEEVLPENNPGMEVVPQILTNQSEYFLRTARKLKESYGYEEINLNLGCPSGTVVSKGKGAGFLARKEELHRFLEEIFADSPVKISIKTRLGMEEPEEFYELLPMFNEYPLYELIIHPRVKTEGYKGVPHWDIFETAVRESKNPLCYNGDIRTLDDYKRMREVFPSVERLMIGRGLLANPMLAERIKSYEAGETDAVDFNKDFACFNGTVRLKEFHDKLYASYLAEIQGDINVLFKMKEFWVYFGEQFPEQEKCLKQIKKANKRSNYETAVRQIFGEE